MTASRRRATCTAPQRSCGKTVIALRLLGVNPLGVLGGGRGELRLRADDELGMHAADEIGRAGEVLRVLAFHQHVGGEIGLVFDEPLLRGEAAIRDEERAPAFRLEPQHEGFVVGAGALQAGGRKEHGELHAGGDLRARRRAARGASGGRDWRARRGWRGARRSGLSAANRRRARGGEILEERERAADVLRVAMREDEAGEGIHPLRAEKGADDLLVIGSRARNRSANRRPRCAGGSRRRCRRRAR